MRWTVTGAVCIASLLASPAYAATVIVKSGLVYLSEGKGFRVLTGPKTIGPGASVMAKPGGSAEIVYDEGCRVQVESGSVISVSAQAQAGSIKDPQVEESPCAIGAIDSPVFASPSAMAGAVLTAGVGAAGVAGAVDSYLNGGPTSP